MTEVALGDAIAGVSLGAAGMLGFACFATTFELFQDERPDHHWTCDAAMVLGIAAAATFVVAPTLIHAAHGNTVGMLVSLPARSAVVALAILGVAVESDALFFGALLAAPVVAMFDWFVLAEEPSRQVQAGGELSPILAIARDGAAIGLRGCF